MPNASVLRSSNYCCWALKVDPAGSGGEEKEGWLPQGQGPPPIVDLESRSVLPTLGECGVQIQASSWYREAQKG